MEDMTIIEKQLRELITAGTTLIMDVTPMTLSEIRNQPFLRIASRNIEY